jgi:hypothetical protein
MPTLSHTADQVSRPIISKESFANVSKYGRRLIAAEVVRCKRFRPTIQTTIQNKNCWSTATGSIATSATEQDKKAPYGEKYTPPRPTNSAIVCFDSHSRAPQGISDEISNFAQFQH